MAHIPNPTDTSPDVLGPPGTLLFEDDRVRIWELVMKPGEVCNWHQHDTDHLLVVMEGADFEAEFSDGSVKEATIPSRRVYINAPGHRSEIARNVSPDRVFRELIIDLKQSGGGQPASIDFFRPDTASTCRSPG